MILLNYLSESFYKLIWLDSMTMKIVILGEDILSWFFMLFSFLHLDLYLQNWFVEFFFFSPFYCFKFQISFLLPGEVFTMFKRGLSHSRAEAFILCGFPRGVKYCPGPVKVSYLNLQFVPHVVEYHPCLWALPGSDMIYSLYQKLLLKPL